MFGDDPRRPDLRLGEPSRLPAHVRPWFGDSWGHWEGNTRGPTAMISTAFWPPCTSAIMSCASRQVAIGMGESTRGYFNCSNSGVVASMPSFPDVHKRDPRIPHALDFYGQWKVHGDGGIRTEEVVKHGVLTPGRRRVVGGVDVRCATPNELARSSPVLVSRPENLLQTRTQAFSRAFSRRRALSRR